MTVEDALEQLSAFVKSAPPLEAAAVARSIDTDGRHEARVLSLANDAESFFRDTIQKAVVDQLPNWSLRALDPVYKPETHEVEWSEAANVQAIELARNRYANLGPLDSFHVADDDYLKRLLFWVCVLTGADDRRAFFFRAFSASSELQRKKATALVNRDGAFTKVRERIFLFDERVDCVVFDEYLFVLNKKDFRRVFDQLEVVRHEAQKAARDLHGKVPIANFDEFADACVTQAGMADKLISVRKRDYFDRLSYEMLQPVIEEFSLKIPTQEHDGLTHLVFLTEPAHRWRILRLIDDDYLKSSMTDHKYEVNSKGTPPT